MGETREHKIERLQDELAVATRRHLRRESREQLVRTVTRAVKLDTKITWQGHKLYGRRAKVMRTDLFEGVG